MPSILSDKLTRMLVNSGVFGASRVTGLILGIINISLLSRHLGVDQYGDYTFAIRFTALFLPFIDFSLDKVITREIVQDKANALRYVYSSFYIRVALSLLCWISIFATASLFLKLSLRETTLVFISSITFLTLSLSACKPYYIANYKMHITAIIEIITQIFSTITLATLIYFNQTIFTLLFSQTFFLFIQAFITGLFFVRKVGFIPSHKFDIRFIIKNTAMFSLSGIFTVFYTNISSAFVYKALGSYSTGLYNSAFKFIDIFILFIGVIMTSFYPLLTESTHDDKSYRKTFNHLFTLMTGAGIGAMIILSINAHHVIRIVYGESFVQATFSLLLFAPAIMVIFPGHIIGYSMVIHKMQKQYFISSLATFIVNVAILMILLPNFSVGKASLAYLVTIIAGNLLQLILLTRHIPGLLTLPPLLKLALISAPLYAAVLWAGERAIAFSIIETLVFCVLFSALFLWLVLPPRRILATLHGMREEYH